MKHDILAAIMCLVLVTLSICAPVGAAAENSALLLPSSVQTISEEAFSGNSSIIEAVIPENVLNIEARAFADCSQLKEVTVLSREVKIDRTAFENCGDLKFNTLQGSTAELFALSHGYDCEILGPESPSYERVAAMLSAYGGMESVLQGKESKRLIVRMGNGRLPDISAYKPVSIVREGQDIFFVQFDTEDDVSDCFTMLEQRDDVEYVEFDITTSAIDPDEVVAAGYVKWSDSDPLGFNEYSTYVAQNQAGSQLIAVIDSGVNSNNAYNHILSSKSINMIDDGQSAFYDGRRHGSVIASIIEECVGNTDVKVMSVRVVNDQGQTTPSLLGQGIAYAVDSGASIINLSLNTSSSEYVKDEIRMAMSTADVVVASGNNNQNTSSVFPANVPGTIVVSGLENETALWRESNTGTQVSFCAPAIGVSTSAYGNIFPGTSFSAPMISATYALLNLDTTHSPADMILKCEDLGLEGRDSAFGYGMPRLDRLAALKVTSIEINEAVPALLKVGDSWNLDYSVLPSKALDRTVSCVSSNPEVVKVEAGEGNRFVLTAAGSGNAVVTITANDGSGVQKSIEIKVVQPVTELLLSADSNELTTSRTMALKLTILPENPDNPLVSWSSSNENVATVSENGVVTPVSPGQVIIRADAQDGYGAWAQIAINVVEIPDPEAVEVYSTTHQVLEGETLEMLPGETLQLLARVYPLEAPQTVTWRAATNGVISVDATGQVTANKSGSSYVVVTTVNNISKIFMIDVVIPPTGLEIEGEGIVNVGETITLSALITPSNATHQTVQWESSEPEIATVDKNGVVTGMSSGEVLIKATADGDNSVTKTKAVTVRQMPQSIVIEGETNIYTGSAKQLTANVAPENTYEKSVIWSSSNSAVATVNENGLVTAVRPGAAIITATSAADNRISVTAIIRVKNEWGSWSSWQTTKPQASTNRQVESRIEYQSRTQGYTEWSAPSSWDATRQATSNLKKEEATTGWGYYFYVCPNCGNHCWVTNHCYTWSNGCGYSAYFGDSYSFFWSPTNPENGYQDYCQTGRIMIEDPVYGRAFWNNTDGTQRTIYRYLTRTPTDTGWSGWSTTPVAPMDTNDKIVSVNTRTTYRYRDRNLFTENDYSDWIPENELPAGARVFDTKWVYTEQMISTVPDLEGWTLAGDSWSPIDTGYVRAADFSDYPGFDTSHALYQAYNVEKPMDEITETSKREVVPSVDGYIYWHWMYSVSSTAGDREIYYERGYNPSNDFGYWDFWAHENSAEYPWYGGYNPSNPAHRWYINQQDHLTNAESGGSYYWYRIPIIRYDYTDYSPALLYTREIESTTEPVQNENITNIVKYVRYTIN